MLGKMQEICPDMVEGGTGADVEIMVYLGILDTRKLLGSQKILTKITAILSRK